MTVIMNHDSGFIIKIAHVFYLLLNYYLFIHLICQNDRVALKGIAYTRVLPLTHKLQK